MHQGDEWCAKESDGASKEGGINGGDASAEGVKMRGEGC